jgi:hypothetical protein
MPLGGFKKLAEPDVLRLIVGSNRPPVRRFERWLFEEVLPTVRKTGSYIPDQSAAMSDVWLSGLFGVPRIVIEAKRETASSLLAVGHPLQPTR